MLEKLLKYTLSIPAKISLFACGLVFLTALLVALVSDHTNQKILLNQELQSISHDLENLLPQVTAHVHDAGNDVLFLAATPPIEAISTSPSDPDFTRNPEWKDRLSILFESLLTSKETYLRIRYFSHLPKTSLKSPFQEQINLTRLPSGKIETLYPNSLKRLSLGHELLGVRNLSKGHVFYSSVRLNQRNGQISRPYRPIIHVATPIYSDQGTLIGIIVIDKDFSHKIAHLAEKKFSHSTLHITNADGYYLLTSDPQKHLGAWLESDSETPVRLDVDFPALQPFFSSSPRLIANSFIHTDKENDSIVAFAWAPYDKLDSSHHFGVALTSSYQKVLHHLTENRRQNFLLTITLITITILFALFFSNILTRPLRWLTQTVQSYNEGSRKLKFSRTGSDEIAILANAFQTLIQETEIKNQLLEENEKNTRRILDKTADAIITTNIKGSIISWNQSAELIFGYWVEDIKGRSIRTIIPELKEDSQRNRLDTTTLERQKNIICEGLCKNGIRFPIEVKFSHSLEDGNHILIWCIQDITDRQRSEEEERFKLIVEASPSAMLMVNSEGKMILVNQQAEKLFGYPREELLKLNINALVPKKNQPSHPRMLRNFFHAPCSRIMGKARSVHGLHKNGHEIPIEISLNPIESKSEPLVLASIIDITERRHAEDAIREKERAIQASQLKSDFLATTSHEIRTPLNAIIGTTELLTRSSDLSKQRKEQVKIIQQAGEALLTLINDILDFAKIEAGKLHIESTPFSLKETLQDSLSILKYYLGEKTVDLNIKFPDTFPDKLMGDPFRLKQVLLNLGSNAIKFTHKGSIDIQLDILEVTPHELQFKCSVTDTGIGIPIDKQKNIFDAFEQAQKDTARKHGGSGLGLSICKKLVHLMGGEIGLTSTPGKGSTFWFSLTTPLASVKEKVAHQLKTSGVINPSSVARWLDLKILLVEDTEINRTMILGMFEYFGLKKISIAKNGKEAVTKASSENFDIIFMDCQMPEMDGLEATRIIRKTESKQIPIIALTANVSAVSRRECFEAGMDDFLPKPVKLEALRATIEHWTMSEDSSPASSEQ